jgi:hypothetical protein
VKKGGKWMWERIGKRPQHLFDCEVLQICAAFMLKLIGREAVAEAGTANAPQVDAPESA